MIKCFLVPMTDPPYSRLNNQRPKYVRELQINWSGVPLFNSKMYVIKAASTAAKLALLQASPGVIDYPNIDGDIIKDLPQTRKDKNLLLQRALKIPNIDYERVADFINRSANSETNHGWNKDIVYVPDE